ncbi:hypothetical protein THIOM_002321, partial [Candidatus Thiomargarita nelsonii]
MCLVFGKKKVGKNAAISSQIIEPKSLLVLMPNGIEILPAIYPVCDNKKPIAPKILSKSV